jgi:hypothetical protein
MKTRARQRGVIFIALVLVLLVTGSTLLLGALNNQQSAAIDQQTEVSYQMEAAKQALIAYAKYADDQFIMSPGLLPCPDFDHDEDGISDGDCNPSTEYIGRLPQYVEMPYYTDDDELQRGRFYLNNAFAEIDQQFWYAVSPNFLHTSSGVLSVNSAQSGTLTLDDATDIVAVIIAPGEALDDQYRELNSEDYAQYLEGGNGTGPQFWTAYEENPEAFNDKVLAITRSEIRNSTTYEVVAEEIVDRLDDYHALCGYYPRSPRTNTCSWNFSINSNSLAFRNWVNAAGNPVTWIKETSSGGDNWIASSAMTYSYVNADLVRIDFKQVGTTECIRFSRDHDNSTLTQSVVASC